MEASETYLYFTSSRLLQWLDSNVKFYTRDFFKYFEFFIEDANVVGIVNGESINIAVVIYNYLFR